MLKLVVGYTELGGGKLKICNRFLKPNFELGPKPQEGSARSLYEQAVNYHEHHDEERHRLERKTCLKP